MRNKNRKPELEYFRDRRLKRWDRLNHSHRKATFEAEMKRILPDQDLNMEDWLLKNGWNKKTKDK